jgi:hypothetical protein
MRKLWTWNNTQLFLHAIRVNLVKCFIQSAFLIPFNLFGKRCLIYHTWYASILLIDCWTNYIWFICHPLYIKVQKAAFNGTGLNPSHITIPPTKSPMTRKVVRLSSKQTFQYNMLIIILLRLLNFEKEPCGKSRYFRVAKSVQISSG